MTILYLLYWKGLYFENWGEKINFFYFINDLLFLKNGKMKMYLIKFLIINFAKVFASCNTLKIGKLI